ncbi:MAG: lipopolysaccharide kinase InaA family protein [Planctomycetes bacterium]|nr:lipopolysaccharide kinase InaA family protein [Planctomycetota bacterium]
MADRAVYAKVAYADTRRERLKWVLLGSPAEREWRALLRAHSKGVRAVRGLAVGLSTCRPRQGVLITEAIEGASTLRAEWANRAAIHGKQRRTEANLLIDGVARLFAEAHDRGFVHRDSHPDNILVTRGSVSEGFHAAFVDVQGSRIGHRPTLPGRAAYSLAQLDQYGKYVATRTERWRFLRRYASLRASGNWRQGGRDFLREISLAIERHRGIQGKRLARRRDRRLRRNGRYFATLAMNGGWQATIVLESLRRHVFPEDDIPRRSMGEWRAILDPIVAVASTAAPADKVTGRHGLEPDIQHPRGWLERLWWTVAGSPQWKAFTASHRARHRDIPEELILAYIEHRVAAMVETTVLIRPRRVWDSNEDQRPVVGEE